MHMWTRLDPCDEHVTNLMQVYLVEHVASHGAQRHVVSNDATGWRCTQSDQCSAVAVAQAEHERAERMQARPK